jgi:hypothetical protein
MSNSSVKKQSGTSYKKIYKKSAEHFVPPNKSVSESEKAIFNYLKPRNEKEDDLALKKFLSHVLLYLYNATEEEIYNNLEVNEQLKIIKRVILKMLQDDK